MATLNSECFEKCICSTCKHVCYKKRTFAKFCTNCGQDVCKWGMGHCSHYEKMSYVKYTRKSRHIAINSISKELYDKTKPIC